LDQHLFSTGDFQFPVFADKINGFAIPETPPQKMARRAFRAYGMSVVSVQREPPAGFFAHAQIGRIYAIHHPLFIDGNNRMIGVRHDILSFCRLSEGLDELLPVNLILIDVLAPVTRLRT
jgi:hypothetical protein